MSFRFPSCVAPTFSVAITPSSNGHPNKGERYSLTCIVSGGGSLTPTNQRFQWSRGDSREIRGSQNPDAGTLTFSQIRHSDAGEYRCTASYESPHLTGTYTATGIVMIVIIRKPIAWYTMLTVMHLMTYDVRFTTWWSQKTTIGHTHNCHNPHHRMGCVIWISWSIRSHIQLHCQAVFRDRWSS
jgi:hypothetical protein